MELLGLDVGEGPPQQGRLFCPCATGDEKARPRQSGGGLVC